MATTTVISDTQVAAVSAAAMMKHGCIKDQAEVEFARCECCGLTEECTEAYIAGVRERYGGWWICGLCAEAVKDETWRSKRDRIISTDEALNRHMKFCEQFRSGSPPARPAVELISAVKRVLRRSLDSPGKNRSPTTSFVASKAC